MLRMANTFPLEFYIMMENNLVTMSHIHIICVILKQHFQSEKLNVLEQAMKDIFCCVCVAETTGILCA